MGTNRNGMPSTMMTRQLAASQKLMLEVEAGDTPDAETHPGESEADHGAGIDLLPDETHDGQKNDQHQAAEGEHHSGLGSGVAHDLLQKLRNHDRCGVKRGADHHHDELGHAEVAAAIEREVDDGVRSGELAP